jgi:hypothetical protein
VRAAASVIISDDPALLDEVSAALNLDRLAPTVAASPDPVPDTLAALHNAGYHPEREGAKVKLRRAPASPGTAPPGTAPPSTSPLGASFTPRGPAGPVMAAPPGDHTIGDRTRGDRSSASRAPGDHAPLAAGDRAAGDRVPGNRGPGGRPPRPRSAVDPVELARRLAVPMQRPATPLDQIRQRAPQLRPEQAQLLADAVEHGTPVWIRYVDANGRASERVVENAELSGSVIEAWCRLRRDDRAFTLDKIVAVARPRH